MQYLAELVQHGLGISVLPPMSVRAVTAQVSTIRITPPLRRDICAVIAATRPPTGSAQAANGSMYRMTTGPEDICCWATSRPAKNRTASQRGTARLRHSATPMSSGAT
jgi:hypothetical protein